MNEFLRFEFPIERERDPIWHNINKVIDSYHKLRITLMQKSIQDSSIILKKRSSQRP